MPVKQHQTRQTQSKVKGSSYSSGNPHPEPGKKADHFKLRLAGFTTITLGLLALTLWLINPSFQQSGASNATPDQTIQVTMAGFTPAKLAIGAGKAATVELVNPDSAGHTDGGGVHQFASPALGIDVKVQPRSKLTFIIPAATPGVYNFYCDVCCGGKENPSMQGTIIVS